MKILKTLPHFLILTCFLGATAAEDTNLDTFVGNPGPETFEALSQEQKWHFVHRGISAAYVPALRNVQAEDSKGIQFAYKYGFKKLPVEEQRNVSRRALAEAFAAPEATEAAIKELFALATWSERGQSAEVERATCTLASSTIQNPNAGPELQRRAILLNELIGTQPARAELLNTQCPGLNVNIYQIIVGATGQGPAYSNTPQASHSAQGRRSWCTPEDVRSIVKPIKLIAHATPRILHYFGEKVEMCRLEGGIAYSPENKNYVLELPR